MTGETKSDRSRLCHAQSEVDRDGIPGNGWCSLDTELWWGAAMRFPVQALLQLGESGRLPTRHPGDPCELDGCGLHPPGKEHVPPLIVWPS